MLIAACGDRGTGGSILNASYGRPAVGERWRQTGGDDPHAGDHGPLLV